jgi:hypothetical protein
METERTIVEINGVKMEVDLRHARIVHENIKVGSKVKLLSKNDYSGPQVYAGVVVGFEPFESLPTIIVAYVKDGYNDSGLYFAHVNAKSADKYDLVPSLDDELPIKKEDVLAQFDRKIDKARAELETAEAQRDYFLRHFNRYFATAKAPA